MTHRDPTVVVTARGEERARIGHPWIYRADVAQVRAEGGDVVAVVGARGRRIGRALYSAESQIALRLLTTTDRPVDRQFWRDRLAAALEFRRRLAIDATAYRLVHGEGDLLPSLIVDRYDNYLVVQALSQAMDRLLPVLVELLVELTGTSGVLARHDARVRSLEGLDQHVRAVHGDVPATVRVREAAIEYDVDLWHGQKTGLFLDQRENRQAAARYASGRALDCFSYNGGFAMQMARAASHVTAIDISEEAVARTAQNASANGLMNIEARAANVFDELRRMERAAERYDLIVLDPPAFAKTKAAVPRAVAGYKEINLRALKLLQPGGYLVTCSCSYHVDEGHLLQIVEEAALDARVQTSLVEKRMQARDHPVLVGVPESYYLKCLVLRKLT